LWPSAKKQSILTHMPQVQQPKSPLIDHFEKIDDLCRKGHITLKEIFEIFGTDGHSVLIFFLILPFLQPIPIPGLSTPLGILIALVTGFSYLNKPPWLPARWMNHQLSINTISKINSGSEKLFQKVSKLIHPRWPIFFKDPFRTLSAVLVIFNGLLLALPLPIPFSNAFPAWAIFFYTLAELEDDGLFILLTYLQSLACLIYFTVLIFSFESALPSVLKYFNSF
jgi:hypothetical protein